MPKKFARGAIVAIPKNFALAEHRNQFATVLEVNGMFLKLRTRSGEFTATTADISGKRCLSVQERWDIMNRDQFRCRVCGHHTDHVRSMNVDHARSYHEGGKTELDNLWTICTLCNIGKGSRSMEMLNEPPRVSTTDLQEMHERIQRLSEWNEGGYGFPHSEVVELLELAKKFHAEINHQFDVRDQIKDEIPGN